MKPSRRASVCRNEVCAARGCSYAMRCDALLPFTRHGFALLGFASVDAGASSAVSAQRLCARLMGSYAHLALEPADCELGTVC